MLLVLPKSATLLIHLTTTASNYFFYCYLIAAPQRDHQLRYLHTTNHYLPGWID